LLQAFEDDRVLESIRPPDNLFGNLMALVLADFNSSEAGMKSCHWRGTGTIDLIAAHIAGHGH
jgi:hypothetical protein